MAQAKAYIVGTLDTKGEELLYIRDLLAADGVQACVVDVGTGSAARPPGVDVSASRSPPAIQTAPMRCSPSRIAARRSLPWARRWRASCRLAR